MHRIVVSSLFVIASVSVAGCAGMLSIPEEQQLVSNYRAASNSTAHVSCDISTPRPERASNDNQPGLDPAAIRLLNWNVYKGTRENWVDDFNRLSRGSDIVALQEAQLHPAFKAGLEQNDLHWDLSRAFTYDKAETGVLLGSNTIPGTICSLHSMEPIISIPKTALVAEYPLQGNDNTLMIANIHMINFSLGTAEYEKQITRLKQVLASHQGPLIITGDFNTWSEARLKIIRNITAELQLSAVEYSNDQRMTVFGNTVDHVYYRGLETIEASTQQVESSDHNPMLVTFRLSSL